MPCEITAAGRNYFTHNLVPPPVTSQVRAGGARRRAERAVRLRLEAAASAAANGLLRRRVGRFV